ncbi:DnaB-like helicase N-terminal domain-containing protein [Sphaerisporangium sp. NPDC005288]|uniref:DnaB-like helicase N-terminal domain-containing protein n=1 Tax=Sphaerisporangium sp. NPDC005288 TaxID=3155114 RepID=UPI0033B23034
MPDLVHRTEEALIGALIYDPSLVNDVPYLLPRHFHRPDHQAVFAAFLDVHANEPAIWGAAMADRIIQHADVPGIDATRLAALALSSPDVSSIAVYGRMVQEAALHRDLLDHADRLAEAAGPTRGLDAERDHMALLSQALRSNAVRFDIETDAALPAQAVRQDLRILREEALLADLIQHPEHLRGVAAWLDPEVFTSTDRRDIYEAIVAVDRYGEPVEELTLTWELARARSAAPPLTQETSTGQDAPLAASGYVARLARTAVESGIALEIGRDLLADHTRAEFTAGTAPRTADAEVTRNEQLTREALHREHRLTRATADPHLASPHRALGLDGPELRQ